MSFALSNSSAVDISSISHPDASTSETAVYLDVVGRAADDLVQQPDSFEIDTVTPVPETEGLPEYPALCRILFISCSAAGEGGEGEVCTCFIPQISRNPTHVSAPKIQIVPIITIKTKRRSKRGCLFC